jgi:hypothetical protein
MQRRQNISAILRYKTEPECGLTSVRLIDPIAAGDNWMVTRHARIDRKLNREPAVASRE